LWKFVRSNVFRCHAREVDGSTEDRDHHDASPRDRALARIVDAYIKNDLVNIPLVPDFVEKRIYSSILNAILDRIERLANDSNISFLGHLLKIDVDPVCGLAGGIYQSKEDEGHAEGGLTTEQLREREQEENERDALIDHLTQAFFDANVTDKNDIPFGGIVTDFLEKRFYRNVLRMCIGILFDTLRKSSIDFLGYRITPSVKSMGTLLSSSSCSESSSKKGGEQRTDDDRKRTERTERTRCVIDNLVEDIMRKNENKRGPLDAMSLVPAFIERYLYTRAFGVIITMLDECTDTLRISILHHRLSFDFVPPTPVPHAESA